MSEHTGIVKSIEAKQSGNGKSFWTIAWQDGSKDNIFKPDWLPNLQKSQATGQLVNYTKEPTPDGKFQNIKSVALATLPEKPPAAQPLYAPQSPQNAQQTALPAPVAIIQPVKPEMSKADWAEKDKVTRKSIERQKALELAVMLATSSKMATTTGQIIMTAKAFEKYLAGEEVQLAKTLVEEAQKLGATEIKKGETTT